MIRSDLRTLIRLAPEVTTTLIVNANLNILLDRATEALALDGRALPRNEQVNAVASQREYVVSGASPLLTKDDFLAIDANEGGVLFNDGSRWISAPELRAVDRGWLDRNQPDWRTATTSASPEYWYLSRAADNSDNLVVGFHPIPSTSRTDAIWIHYLSRGRLFSADTDQPFTASASQLVYLAPYEMGLVYWCLEFILRVILDDPEGADGFKTLYLESAARMALRAPLAQHLTQEAFTAETSLGRASGLLSGRRF